MGRVLHCVYSVHTVQVERSVVSVGSLREFSTVANVPCHTHNLGPLLPLLLLPTRARAYRVERSGRWGVEKSRLSSVAP